jgi:hypothetical protein
MCNSPEHKGIKFPTSASGGPYINPCNDDPDLHFEFIYDKATNVTTVFGTSTRGNTTASDLGLNRVTLVKHRSPYVRQLMYVALKLQANNADLEALNIMVEAIDPKSEYSAFAKAIISKLNLQTVVV